MSRRVPSPTSGTTRQVPARGRPVEPRRNFRWVWGVAALAVLAVVAVAVILLNRDSTTLENVQTFENLSRDHVETAVEYEQVPPVGGPHNPRWQNCGIYDQPIENPYAVHSLEHGAVWITYQPDLAAAEVEQIRSVARGQPFVLVSPYPDLPTPVVASAWGVQLQLDSVDTAQLRAFIQQYERGPQTPEPGATCRSGVGVPIAR
jgi:hypothetical protein